MRGGFLALLIWSGVGTGVPNAGGHPMHTAVVELAYDGSARAARISIRLFADDFAAAIADASGIGPDSAASRYLGRTFSLTDRSGRPLPLRWQAAERAGDVLVIRLAVVAPQGLNGLRVASRILCERFPDQITVVRAAYSGRSATLLFSPGDGPKALP